KAAESPAANPTPQPPPESDPTPVVTNTNDAGDGSLRAAVALAAELPGPDTVTFAPSVTGTIHLTSGAISTLDKGRLTIQGPGADELTIDAGGDSRVFEFGGYYSGTAGTVVVSGLTLTDGHASRTFLYDGETHTTEAVGGAVLDRSRSLTLSETVITDSHGSRGGAVVVRAGDLAVTDSELTGNHATSGGGAVSVTNGDDVTITGSTISGNESGWLGGGVDISRADSFLMDESTISGNTADDGGGGLRLGYLNQSYYDDDPAGATITDSQISGNSTDGVAGGLGIFDGLYGGTTVRFETVVENTTIADNDAGTKGGGVYVGNQSSTDAEQTFTSTTIAHNTAPSTGGLAAGSGTKLLQSSIVADNTNGDLGLDGSSDPFSLDFSLVESAGSTPVTHVTLGSNILGTDPQLGALADNGGPTRTMAPAGTSPVIDAGKAFGTTVDQRGQHRPVDVAGVPNAADASDMGSVEVQSGVAVATVP
ncbi:choice-of-anchor Q domain-containing protein, partial [Nocardioides hankookensis]